jgi:hypothetical protein
MTTTSVVEITNDEVDLVIEGIRQYTGGRSDEEMAARWRSRPEGGRAGF